jgi:hypothetical protein
MKTDRASKKVLYEISKRHAKHVLRVKNAPPEVSRTPKKPPHAEQMLACSIHEEHEDGGGLEVSSPFPAI